MGADHNVRFELCEMADKTLVGIVGERSAKAPGAADFFGIIGFFKNHSVNFRGVLYDFDITPRINLAIKFGGKIKDIDAFNDIARAKGASGFLQR